MGPFPCHLLLDLPNWLGDLVHALPALRILLDANQRGETVLLLPASFKGLVSSWPAQAVSRPKDAGWAFRRRLPRPEVALTFRHSTRAKLLLAGLGAQRALGSKGRLARFLGLEVFAVDRRRHQRHDMDEALRRLALPPVDGHPAFLFAPARPADGGRVAIVPGSHRAEAKRYPSDWYAWLAGQLAQGGFRVTVVVGPADASLGEHIATRAQVELFPPKASLAEVAGFLSSVRLVVGNDSGLTHLAAAVGCRAVALFGPTSPVRTAPMGGVSLQAPDFQRLGWQGLPPERVLAVVERALTCREETVDGKGLRTDATPPGVAPWHGSM